MQITPMADDNSALGHHNEKLKEEMAQLQVDFDAIVRSRRKAKAKKRT